MYTKFVEKGEHFYRTPDIKVISGYSKVMDNLVYLISKVETAVSLNLVHKVNKVNNVTKVNEMINKANCCEVTTNSFSGCNVFVVVVVLIVVAVHTGLFVVDKSLSDTH